MNLPQTRSLKLSEENGLLRLTFDHGKVNEMGTAELDDFAAVADYIESNPDIFLLVTTSSKVTSSGKPIFQAGANVTERQGWDREKTLAHLTKQRETMRRMATLPVFHLIIVNGITKGWGMEYLLTGDYRAAYEKANFSLPETSLGIVPGAGGSSILPRTIPYRHALFLAATGKEISASEAKDFGLIEQILTGEEAESSFIEDIRNRLSAKPPVAIAALKKAITRSAGWYDEDLFLHEEAAYRLCLESGDAELGRNHFADIIRGNPPKWSPRK